MHLKNFEDTNSSRTLFLHIGIPKTATTWLQTKVFPRIDHLKCLNCPESSLFNDNDVEQAEERFLGKVFKMSCHVWSKMGDEIFKELVGDQEKWLADDRNLLISDEGIGRWASRPVLFSSHIQELQKKAAEWGFDNVFVIYVIRRQDHWLASHYAQISDLNPEAGQSDFYKFVNKITSPQLSRYEFGMLLDYHLHYSKLTKLIGVDRLLILPYEKLNASPDLFLNTLLYKIGTPPDKIEQICAEATSLMINVRSGREHGTWRLRNSHLRIQKLPLMRSILSTRPQTVELTPEIKSSIKKAYADSNKKLSKLSGMNLEQYGYFSFHEIEY